MVTCPRCQHSFHQYQHLQRYTPESLNALFRPKFHLVKLEGVVSTQIERMPGFWHLISFYLHRKGRNFSAGAVCPQCGFKLENPAAEDSHPDLLRSTRRTLHRFWPKSSTFNWWMALYRSVI
jgi:hypothetical protein